MACERQLKFSPDGGLPLTSTFVLRKLSELLLLHFVRCNASEKSLKDGIS